MKEILVVDDECPIVGFFRFFLEKSGEYRVIETHDEKGALDILGGDAIELAIVDINLENGSGEAVIEAANRKGLKVIGITGNSSFECLGIDMMYKPFNPKDLIAKVKEILG